MELTHEEIAAWLRECFAAYNAYAQSPQTAYRLHAYLAPDVELLPYAAGLEHLNGRDELLAVTSSHPSSVETVTPDGIFVDERQGTVVVLARAEVADRETGEVAVEKSYLAHFELVPGEDGRPRIRKITFFWERLAPGALDVHEVFQRDR